MSAAYIALGAAVTVTAVIVGAVAVEEGGNKLNWPRVVLYGAWTAVLLAAGFVLIGQGWPS